MAVPRLALLSPRELLREYLGSRMSTIPSNIRLEHSPRIPLPAAGDGGGVGRAPPASTEGKDLGSDASSEAAARSQRPREVFAGLYHGSRRVGPESRNRSGRRTVRGVGQEGLAQAGARDRCSARLKRRRRRILRKERSVGEASPCRSARGSG